MSGTPAEPGFPDRVEMVVHAQGIDDGRPSYPSSSMPTEVGAFFFTARTARFHGGHGIRIFLWRACLLRRGFAMGAHGLLYYVAWRIHAGGARACRLPSIQPTGAKLSAKDNIQSGFPFDLYGNQRRRRLTLFCGRRDPRSRRARRQEGHAGGLKAAIPGPCRP